MSSEKILNILVIPAWFQPKNEGHTGQFIRDAAMSISALGHKVTVLNIVPSQEKSGTIHAITENYVEYYLYERLLPSIIGRLQVRKIVYKWVLAHEARHGRFDVIHTHGLVAIDKIILLRRRLALPVLHTEHLGLLTLAQVPKRIKWQAQYLYRYVDAILTVSPGMAASLKGLTDRPINVLGGIVAQQFFETTLSNQPNELPTYICVSDFDKTKGHLTLLKAFGKLKEQGFRFKLHLVGDGPLRPSIQRQIDQLDLGTSVILHGTCTRDEICQIMQGCDLYCTASEYESFGTHIAEGIAMGLFTVCVHSVGPASFINDINGILVQPNDLEALTTALYTADRNRPGRKKSDIRASIIDLVHPSVTAQKTSNHLIELHAQYFSK